MGTWSLLDKHQQWPVGWGFAETHGGAGGSWHGGTSLTFELFCKLLECPAEFPVQGQHASVQLYGYVLEIEGYSVGQVQELLDWRSLGWALPQRLGICPPLDCLICPCAWCSFYFYSKYLVSLAGRPGEGRVSKGQGYLSCHCTKQQVSPSENPVPTHRGEFAFCERICAWVKTRRFGDSVDSLSTVMFDAAWSPDSGMC